MKRLGEMGFEKIPATVGVLNVIKTDISWKSVVAKVRNRATQYRSDCLKITAVAQIEKFLEKDFTGWFSIT